MAANIKTVLIRLYKDAAFRKSFAENPHGTLVKEGLDVGQAQLPAKLGLRDLEEHMLTGAKPNARGGRLTLAEIATLPDEKIWTQFKDKIQPVGNKLSAANPPIFVGKLAADAVFQVAAPVAVYAATVNANQIAVTGGGRIKQQ